MNLKIIEELKNKNSVKSMTFEQLEELKNEIRQFLIENISTTGGHLSSNLGVVEATIALYKAFDFPKDKIVFDVGHQCYVYKILSGRIDEFKTLRQFGGMSGFPKQSESEYDIFNSGHSSNSISVALGIKRGLDRKKDNSNVIAFIGDGALTGGMAYEALNDAGRSKSNIIIVLNDNEMSISKNVGGIAKHLASLRTSAIYMKMKTRFSALVLKIPLIGNPLYKLISSLKRLIRTEVLKQYNNIFEQLGFYYAGPYDGHDIKTLYKAFSRIKKVNKPAIVHIITKKGMGYKFAQDEPDCYHGVKAFDAKYGIDKTKCANNFSMEFGRVLTNLARENNKIIAITAAMPTGTGLDSFKEEFPDRYFDVAIAEGHAVGVAAGLAISGFVPVFAVYSSFLLRGYDQLLTDVCGMNLHCVFCVDRSGLVGEDGETHQGIFDIAYLSIIPNITVFSPATYDDLQIMMKSAIFEYNSPCAIRYSKGKEDEILSKYKKEYIKNKAQVLKEGTDISIICEGTSLHEGLKASELLGKSGINAEVINLRYVKPMDEETVVFSINKTKRAVVVENGTCYGGLYSKISTLSREKIISISIPDCFIPQGTVKELYNDLKMDSVGIYEKVMKEFFS